MQQALCNAMGNDNKAPRFARSKYDTGQVQEFGLGHNLRVNYYHVLCTAMGTGTAAA